MGVIEFSVRQDYRSHAGVKEVIISCQLLGQSRQGRPGMRAQCSINPGNVDSQPPFLKALQMSSLALTSDSLVP